MKSNRGVTNTILLGFSSLLSSSVTITLMNLLAFIREDLQNDLPQFEPSGVEGYVLFNTFTCLGAVATPFLLRYTSPKWVIVFCAFLDIWYTFQYLFPNNFAFLFYSALSGSCLGLTCVCLLTLINFNSHKRTIERNLSMYLGIAESGRIFGSLLTLGILRSKFDKNKRVVLISALGTTIFFSSIFVILLHRPLFEPRDVPTRMDILRSTARLLSCKDFWLYLGVCVYIGWVGAYVSRTYVLKISATDAFRTYFGPYTLRMSAIHGVALGIGQCSATLLYTLLGRQIRQVGRCFVIIFAFFLTATAIFWIMLNVPNRVNETEQIARGAVVVIPGESAILKSNVFVAFVCSFLLGFADVCFKVVVYGMVGDVFEREATVAFAFCKIVEVAFEVVAHFLGACEHMVSLGVHFGLLLAGTGCFIYAYLRPSYVSRGTLVVFVDDHSVTRDKKNVEDVLKQEEEEFEAKMAKQLREKEIATGENR